jgi:DNA-binding XRE family transcriptional regulator
MQLLDSLLTPSADESLGQYLRRLRLHRGLSQADVVELAGIHLQSLGKIERGRTLKLNHKTCSGLAYTLNVPKEYLESVGRCVAVDVPSALKFCPSCWTVGMPPESMWLDLRAKCCFLCDGVTSSLCGLSRADYFPEASFLPFLWDILSIFFIFKSLIAESISQP